MYGKHLLGKHLWGKHLCGYTCLENTRPANTYVENAAQMFGRVCGGDNNNNNKKLYISEW